MKDILRHVKLDRGFTLMTWDTHRTDHMGKSTLGYNLSDRGGETIFEGEDFHCGMGTAIDSDSTLRSIMTFLTCRPGDVEQDYFKDYDGKQIAWRDEFAEEMSLWALDDGPEFMDA